MKNIFWLGVLLTVTIFLPAKLLAVEVSTTSNTARGTEEIYTACLPRPACLDANPPCRMPEKQGNSEYCPSLVKAKAGEACTSKSCEAGFTCKYVSNAGKGFGTTEAIPRCLKVGDAINDENIIICDSSGKCPTGSHCNVTVNRCITDVTSKSSGDANGDGKVDLIDFAIWKKEYLGEVATKMADFNNDGKADLTDYPIWVSAYLSSQKYVKFNY